MHWYNEPAVWAANGDTLTVTADHDTDFWRKTHYGFIRDNGHFYYQEVAGDFRCEVKVSGGYAALYDQAGLMVRLDAETWLKCGIEFVEGVQYVSAVVTRDFSDWSVVALPGSPAALWLRVVRTGPAIEISYALDGENYTMLRLTYLTEAERVQVGPMCAAPKGPGFPATLRGVLGVEIEVQGTGIRGQGQGTGIRGQVIGGRSEAARMDEVNPSGISPQGATKRRSRSEFRAFWVDAYHAGIKSPAEIDQLIRDVRAARANAVLVQVRRRGDAYYNRSIEPRVAELRKQPDFDPLAHLIEAAHAVPASHRGACLAGRHAARHSQRTAGRARPRLSQPRPGRAGRRDVAFGGRRRHAGGRGHPVARSRPSGRGAASRGRRPGPCAQLPGGWHPPRPHPLRGASVRLQPGQPGAPCRGHRRDRHPRAGGPAWQAWRRDQVTALDAPDLPGGDRAQAEAEGQRRDDRLGQRPGKRCAVAAEQRDRLACSRIGPPGWARASSTSRSR